MTFYGEITQFKDINKLKQTFQIGAEHNQVFICMGMYFMIFLQYSIMILQYSSITIHQKESIDRMSEIKLKKIFKKKKKKKKKKKRKEKNSNNKLTNVEITLLTGALGKIN